MSEGRQRGDTFLARDLGGGMSVFEGTRFEKLENSIKNELNRKRKSLGHSVGGEEKAGKKVKTPGHSNTRPTSRPRPRPRPQQATDKSADKIKAVPSKPLPQKSVVKTSSVIDQNNLPPGSEDYMNNRTVYIQGLPFTASEQDVRSFFKDCGDIASVRLPKWHDSGKLKGYGHVEFKKAEGATKALDLNGEYLMDRYLSIDRPMVPRALTGSAEPHEPSEKPVGCRTIFIKNLPYETTEAEITQAFMVYGPVKSVRLAVWNHTGKLKGIGYVDFKREDSAETAVKKSGTVQVQGRRVVVDYETGAPKGSFKGTSGPSSSSKAKK